MGISNRRLSSFFRRLTDCVCYILSQSLCSDINFQWVPVVNTSDPIIVRDIPTINESTVVIRPRWPDKFDVDFTWLLHNSEGSWRPRRNTIVVPGGKIGVACS